MPVAALKVEGLSALTNLPMMALSSACSSACCALPSSATKCACSCSACTAGSSCAQGLSVTLRLVRHLSSHHWASCVLPLFLCSSGVMSSSCTSLQYGAFLVTASFQFFNGPFIIGVGLMEVLCDFVCLIKSCQDDGTVDGEVVSRGDGDTWTDAVIDKLVAFHASGAMSLAPSGMGEKHTASVAPPDSLTAIWYRLCQFVFPSPLSLGLLVSAPFSTPASSPSTLVAWT